MEGLVVIIIILVVVSNLRKQTKGKNRSGNGTPYKPAEGMPRDAQPQDAERRAPAEGVPTQAAPEGGTARPMRKPFAPRPLTPVAPMGPMRPAKPARPAQPAAPAQEQTMLPERPVARREETMLPERPVARREETMLPERPTARPMQTLRPAQPSKPCDDGYGSLEHTRHEGEEFHSPGTHGMAGRKPGALAAQGTQAVAMASDEAVPELLGMELDAETMRRAVVFSEIINKRGGRHGWVRI